MVRGALDLGSEETEKKQSQSLEATVLLLYSVQYALLCSGEEAEILPVNFPRVHYLTQTLHVRKI